MRKLKKILQLNDPYPNFRYEISCYLKAALGLILFILSCFFLLSPWLRNDLVIFGFALILNPLGRTLLAWQESLFGEHFVCLSLGSGVLLVALSVWVFGKIKIIRQLFKILKS